MWLGTVQKKIPGYGQGKSGISIFKIDLEP